ncbi:MAG TPA: FAD:protein FMN transferase [Desulfobacterales bacterium]
MNRTSFFLSACLGTSIFLTVIFGCGPTEYRMTGNTMGTTYTVKVVAVSLPSTADLKERIDRRLEAINQSMSTYRQDSEISRFNRFGRVGERFPISNDFSRVMQVAEQVHRLSGGAWDPTVAPLVELWGFGRMGPPEGIPSAEAIRAALARVGFDRITLFEDRVLAKRDADVQLDLASIAKGYGVDQVAVLLKESGYKNFLVEIGGEVYAAGRRKDGGPWKIGVNRPEADAPQDAVYRVAALSDRAMATSGDYRNFFEIAGRRYAHVIDPRTGRPVTNGVVSVTVTADSCTLADALATALMVMGPTQGLPMIESLPNVEALVIVGAADGNYRDVHSSGFFERSAP